MKRALGVVLVLSAWAWSAGCSSYAPPRMAVTAARTEERTSDGVRLLFRLEGQNPNEVALPLKGVTYTVYLDDRVVFTAFRSPEATLRRFGTRELELPAVVSPEAAASARTYRVEGVLEYTTPGAWAELLFENDLRRPKVPFSGRGTLDGASGG